MCVRFVPGRGRGGAGEGGARADRGVAPDRSPKTTSSSPRSVHPPPRPPARPRARPDRRAAALPVVPHSLAMRRDVCD